MTIAFQNYVDIRSSVGGTATIVERQLITRIVTENELVPTNGTTTPISVSLQQQYSVLEFNSAQSVGNYFGTTSTEYLRSLFYFGWVSKLFTTAGAISFSRWASSNTAPQIFGTSLSSVGTTLASLTAITDGSFTLTLGGVTNLISGLDFSTILSFADAALIIEAAINAETGAQWTGATVTYSASQGGFNFVGGDDTVAANVIVDDGTVGTDIAYLMGWLPIAGLYPKAPIFSFGIQEEQVAKTLEESSNYSNNFGSYLFDSVLTEEQVIESATWNSLENVLYMYLVPVTFATASVYAANLASIGGTALTLQVTSGEYAEQIPGMILAATPYDKVGSTQNYMFQQFAVTPSVTDTATADAYNAIGVNYYGLTQTAGQQIAFYQQGVLTGAQVSTNAIDQNVYANEQWLKNANSAALGELLIASTKISANAQGEAKCLVVLERVAQSAVSNGVISIGSSLTPTQISDIILITQDERAPAQIQTSGYWVDTYVTNVANIYTMNYTLLYKKDDVIRKIIGDQILI